METMNNECVPEQPICKYGNFYEILLVRAYSAGADLAWCGADLANGWCGADLVWWLVGRLRW